MVQQATVDSTIEVYTSIMLYSRCTRMWVYAHMHLVRIDTELESSWYYVHAWLNGMCDHT